MKKQTKVSISIIGLFTIAILLSFIPDNFHSFFNDVYCPGNISPNICNDGTNYPHGATWHWGYRHWLWFMMGMALAITQIVGIVGIIENEK